MNEYIHPPPSRRTFLRAGTLALGGLTFPDVVAARPASPPDTAVILFWMWGGPSHFETFDPKPEAPEGIRGPFRAIATTVPGIQICELFPKIAGQAHRYALVRSLHHALPNHNDGSIEVLTGKTPARPDPTSTNFSEHPDFGMVAAERRGRRTGATPGYVGVPRVPFMVRPNYLGVGARGFDAGDPTPANYAPANLSRNAALTAERLAARHALMSEFDRLRCRLDRATTMHGPAMDLLTGPDVARAFDLQREDPRLRDRYGRHLWGQSCLLARRLVEAGTVVVTVDALAPKVGDRYFSWDDHINPATKWDLGDAMRHRAPFMDEAISTLIDDLHDRGLDRRVMVVCVGEFGRTPRVVRDAATGVAGRDHWPQAFCAWWPAAAFAADK